MALTIKQLEKLIGRISFYKIPIAAVFHPRATSGLMAMSNGVNVRLERGPYGYQLSNGKMYPENRI